MLRKFQRLFQRRPSRKAIAATPFHHRFPYKGPLDLSRADRLLIVDTNQCFAYNRIAKAANSTIIATLAETALHRSVRGKKSEVLGAGGFLPASALKEEDVEALSSYFKFTFVRDPYSRALSAYLNKVVLHRRKPWNNGPTPSFLEFCRVLERGHLKPDQHFLPQIDLLLLPVDRFDFIGRFERFGSDFASVLDRLGLPSTSLVRLGNASEASSKLEKYYDAEARQIIRRIYAADFEAFGY